VRPVCQPHTCSQPSLCWVCSSSGQPRRKAESRRQLIFHTYVYQPVFCAGVYTSSPPTACLRPACPPAAARLRRTSARVGAVLPGGEQRRPAAAHGGRSRQDEPGRRGGERDAQPIHRAEAPLRHAAAQRAARPERAGARPRGLPAPPCMPGLPGCMAAVQRICVYPDRRSVLQEANQDYACCHA